ncbi:MAG: acyl-ACP--UDP-N-acetylglucosamine O-acyltransferase [Bacteroidales bacterium]|nr:acyl-ACP--UDP-N-acetylglucosamine O-acyltransferase [Candidatus Latescibacterota bacterium]
MSPKIHPSAVVSERAKLAQGVEIGPFSVIGPDVTIGEGTVVGSNVLIEGYTTLGSGNKVFHGAAIGSEPQDLKYSGEKSHVRIGSNNTIREYVTINLAAGENESTVVGDDCLLMAYVHLAHNCVLGSNVILANAVNLAGHVTIGDWAIIGGMVPVHQFVSIGAHSFVGGGSRVSQDIPPFFKFGGCPTKPSGLNTVGLERRGFTVEQRNLLKKAYRYIYRSGLNLTPALERIRDELPQTPEIESLLEFIGRSQRGLTR